jgi:hypothetical protein
MQFTFNRNTRSGSADIGLAIGTQQNHLLVNLFGFGLSVSLWGKLWGLHWEGYMLGKQGAGGVVYLGPFEFTGQVPAWVLFGENQPA